MTTEVQIAAEALRTIVTPGSVWRAKRKSLSRSDYLVFKVKFHTYPDNRVEVCYIGGEYRGATDLSIFHIVDQFDKIE